jgi:hypothetical protein
LRSPPARAPGGPRPTANKQRYITPLRDLDLVLATDSGSLLWEGGREFDELHGPWQFDGPSLQIEFSRVSKSRKGALTLVIDPSGTTTPVAWCRSKRQRIEDAVCDLRSRERTTIENIGKFRVSEEAVLEENSSVERYAIAAWAREKNVDAVVWTALKSNFEAEAKQPFSVAAVISYLKTLSPEGKAKAAEYVWRAPVFVQTPVRAALQNEPWFPR